MVTGLNDEYLAILPCHEPLLTRLLLPLEQLSTDRPSIGSRTAELSCLAGYTFAFAPCLAFIGQTVFAETDHDLRRGLGSRTVFIRSGHLEITTSHRTVVV
jgi:hypothetical protein